MKAGLCRIAHSVAIVLLAGFGTSCSPDEDGQAPTSSAVKNFLGNDTVAILANADRVECYRIDGSVRHITTTPPSTQAVLGYAVLSTGPTQNAAFAGRLNAILFDQKTYRFDAVKTCIFEPGVVFRVWRGQRHVDVLVCFKCDELRFETYDHDDSELKSGQEDFDGNRAALLELSKEVFPNDPDLAALQ
jgi:hypothetical protein